MEIAFEISNAIPRCLGSNLDITWAQVISINGFQGKRVEKTFSKTGRTGEFDNPTGGYYNLNDLSDFIESKGDMLRTIEIHFTE